MLFTYGRNEVTCPVALLTFRIWLAVPCGVIAHVPLPPMSPVYWWLYTEAARLSICFVVHLTSHPARKEVKKMEESP